MSTQAEVRTAAGEAFLDEPALLAAVERDLATASSPAAVRQVRNRHLGRDSTLAIAHAQLRTVPVQHRPQRGRQIQRLRQTLEQRLATALDHAKTKELNERLEAERADVTMPGLAHDRGAAHPLTQVVRRCCEVLRRYGFVHVDGPEVETAFHNFEALNMDEHHPARDLQDTFWITDDLLLRSHNTTVQAAVLEKRPKPPVKVMSAGRAYRNEAVDATHLAMFHQFEGVWVEAGLTLPDLKGLLLEIAKATCGPDARFRFKPKYYPYTEPSLGLDVGRDGGWVTVLGAGMIHPRVLERFGYDETQVQGIAFGLGISRMVTHAYGLPAMKPLYEQDLRVHRRLHGGGL